MNAVQQLITRIVSLAGMAVLAYQLEAHGYRTGAGLCALALFWLLVANFLEGVAWP